jgi:hypothetical protein
MTAVDRESAFAELVRDYENLWIAIDEKDGVQVVVGSGRNAVEAVAAADANGFPDAVLFKVPSFRSTFILSVTSLSASH